MPVPRLPSAPTLSTVLCDSGVAEHSPDMSSEPECQEPVQMQGVCHSSWKELLDISGPQFSLRYNRVNTHAWLLECVQ